MVEGLIALVLGAMVFGAGMFLYLTGNRMFTKTTEHASFREEALLILDRMQKDLDQLMVPSGMNPNGNYWLVEPYILERRSDITLTDPKTGQKVKIADAGKRLLFPKYHHTAMKPHPAEPGLQIPVLVARTVEYEIKEIDPSDPNKGVDILRNGKRVNKAPIAAVVFRTEPVASVANQVQGSPHAVLTVEVLPQAGLWRSMDWETLQALHKDGKIVSRTVHMVGYESQYTATLWRAMQKYEANRRKASAPPP